MDQDENRNKDSGGSKICRKFDRDYRDFSGVSWGIAFGLSDNFFTCFYVMV